MRAVVQRVTEASVTADGRIISSAGSGLLVLLGIEHADTGEDAGWLSRKITALRIFDDKEGVMNLDVRQAGGEIMVISQFTLHAKTKKGNRPSYVQAAPPETAVPLFREFIDNVSALTGKPVKTGEFGSRMEVGLINSGPVTIIIDTKNRE